MAMNLMFLICYFQVFTRETVWTNTCSKSQRFNTPEGIIYYRSYFCCDNYMYDDQTNRCNECKVGYMSFGGESCKKCPAGSYGIRCADICSCSTNKCDNVLGCQSQHYSSYKTNDITTTTMAAGNKIKPTTSSISITENDEKTTHREDDEEDVLSVDSKDQSPNEIKNSDSQGVSNNISLILSTGSTIVVIVLVLAAVCYYWIKLKPRGNVNVQLNTVNNIIDEDNTGGVDDEHEYHEIEEFDAYLTVEDSDSNQTDETIKIADISMDGYLKPCRASSTANDISVENIS